MKLILLFAVTCALLVVGQAKPGPKPAGHAGKHARTLDLDGNWTRTRELDEIVRTLGSKSDAEIKRALEAVFRQMDEQSGDDDDEPAVGPENSQGEEVSVEEPESEEESSPEIEEESSPETEEESSPETEEESSPETEEVLEPESEEVGETLIPVQPKKPKQRPQHKPEEKPEEKPEQKPAKAKPAKAKQPKQKPENKPDPIPDFIPGVIVPGQEDEQKPAPMPPMNPDHKPDNKPKPMPDASESDSSESPEFDDGLPEAGDHNMVRVLTEFIVTVFSSPNMKAAPLDNDDLEQAYNDLHGFFSSAYTSLMKAARRAKDADVTAMTQADRREGLAALQSMFHDLGKSLRPIMVMLLRDHVYGITSSPVCDLAADDAPHCVGEKLREAFHMVTQGPQNPGTGAECTHMKTILAAGGSQIEQRDALSADLHCLAVKLQTYKASMDELKVLQKLNTAANTLITQDELDLGLLVNAEMDKLGSLLQDAYYHGSRMAGFVAFLTAHV